MDEFSWTDIEDIAIALAETHPQRNPLAVRFTELRELVEQLEGFAPAPGQTVNEQILEAIQAAWHEEAGDRPTGRDDEDERPGGYSPVQPFKPNG